MANKPRRREDPQSGEPLFRSLLEAAPDAMVIVDHEGRIAHVNGQTERLFGYGREELVGGTVERLIPERYRARHVNHRAQYLTAPRARAMGEDLVLYGRRKDGTEFPVDISLGPMETPRGTWTTAAIRDVSERKRREQMLQHSHERLRELAASLKDAQAMAQIGSGELDLRTNRINWSEQAYRIFEVRPGEIDTYDDLLAHIHPEDREETADAYQQSVEQGTSYTLVHRIVTPSGDVKHVRTQGRTFFDDDGQPLRSVGTVQDITEAMRRKQALAESELRYRRLFETSQDGILLIAETTGEVLDVNPHLSELVDYPPDELLGHRVWELPPFNKSDHARQAFRWLQQADYTRHETQIVARDGRKIDVECLSKRYSVGADMVIQCNIRDVTARREAERSLERLNRVRMVLSDINTAIVRCRSREELFENACRIAVEVGGFRLAWIGLLDQGKLHPVAAHGAGADDYVPSLRIDLDPDSCHGQGPTGRAIRERQRMVINDIANDPSMAPWRESALEKGFHASLAYPLIVRDRVEGVLCLYAPEPSFFDAGELSLLDVLCDDIVYAMEFIWNREQIDYLAYYDPLTRLANRTLFRERVDQSVKIAQRDNSMVAVLVIDLARFKSVNDALGPSGADQILQEAGRRVAALVGAESQVGRIGGDVFAAVVPQLEDAGDLSPLLRDGVRDHLNRPYKTAANQELRLSAKIGIAVAPADGDRAATLLRHAESALKHAKESGEDYMFYASEMSQALKQQLTLDSELRRAVEQQEFELHYQPKVELSGGAVAGVEALLRWRHPQRGLVPPDDFVPQLEKNGLIVDVGRWALRRAAADYRAWQDQGLAAPRIAVNVSAIQLRRHDFIHDVANALPGDHSQTTGLELEITESLLVSDFPKKARRLRKLREIGVTSTIDDFGTGHSSLAYLAQLPVGALKIDQSFIRRLVDDDATQNIVATIISLAHSLHLRVIAEGVETRAQLSLLRTLGCDEAQGFLFSHGVNAGEMTALLHRDGNYDVV